MVFTLLEKSAIQREWRGNDGISGSSFFCRAPRPAVERYRKALEAMVREFLKYSVKVWYGDYYMELYFRAQALRRARSALQGFLPLRILWQMR